jgi:6-phosphofructokinase 1
MIMKQFRRIGVLTSGGDAPGMNAAVRAVTRAALAHGVKVVGIKRGYSGLIDGDVSLPGVRDVSNIMNKGGTMLYSDRCPEFQTEEGTAKAVETCRRLEIDGIVAIGGDGTFRGATDLTAHGIPCVGIPGTIDNDIACTDYTIGFYTAMNTVIELVDRLRDTCESHARCNIIEVMGRDSGMIALYAGISAGAVAIAIPEVPFDEEYAISRFKHARDCGKRGMVGLFAEGVSLDRENKYSEEFVKKLEAKTGIETKFARLGHIVRGGSPTLRDRFTASQMGVKALDLILEGKSNLVVIEEDAKITSMEIVFSQMTDRMYKGKLKDGDLEKFTAAQVEEMKQACAQRRAKMEKLYKLSFELSK